MTPKRWLAAVLLLVGHQTVAALDQDREQWILDAGMGLTVGSSGFQPNRLWDIDKTAARTRLAAQISGTYFREGLAGSLGCLYSTDLGIFATSPEQETLFSFMGGWGSSPAGVNFSVFTGLSLAAGTVHGKVNSWIPFRTDFQDIAYLVPSLPLEIRLSFRIWNSGIGFKYHGEVNSVLTSTAFLLYFEGAA